MHPATSVDRRLLTRMYCRSLIPVFCIFLSCATHAAAEVLYSEDFEKFDVSKPPKDVAISGGGDVSVVDDPARGKVLCIKTAGGAYPGLTFSMDINKIRGGTLKFTVAGKCPGELPVVADKPWAKAKLILIAKDKAGKDTYAGGHLEGNKPDWQDLTATFKVGDDVESVQIALRAELVACEVFFDGLKIELEGGGAPAAPGTTPPPATPATPKDPKVAAKTPAGKPLDTTPQGRSPKKTFEDGGMLFGPEIATAMKKAIKPGATPNTILVVGPGLPFKEMDNFKPIGKWQTLPIAKELTGASATPSHLLALLPPFLGKNKPEVVVFFGESTGTRKPTNDERLDWEDLARICKRMGALPVFAVPAAGTQEELRKDLLEGVNLAFAPAIDLKAPSTVPKRLAQMLDLFDRHIFERTPVDAPVAGVIKAPDEE